MEVQAKIKVLVEIFDHRLAGIRLEVPKSVRDIRLLQSTIDKYTPNFFERCQKVTYSVLFLNLKKKVPEATQATFFGQFMSTKLGIEAFRETLAHLHSVLPATVPLEELVKLQRESEGDGA